MISRLNNVGAVALSLQMNRSEVGRVTPCAPSFAPQVIVVAVVGARKNARRQRAADVSSAEPSLFCRQDAGSTLRFMELIIVGCITTTW
jgi:hypothetical protein